MNSSLPLCIPHCPFTHKLIMAWLAFWRYSAGRCGCSMGVFEFAWLRSRCDLCVGAQCHLTKLRSDIWGMDHAHPSWWQAALSLSTYKEEEVCHGLEACPTVSSVLCYTFCGICGLTVAVRLSTKRSGPRFSAGSSWRRTERKQRKEGLLRQTSPPLSIVLQWVHGLLQLSATYNLLHCI